MCKNLKPAVQKIAQRNPRHCFEAMGLETSLYPLISQETRLRPQAEMVFRLIDKGETEYDKLHMGKLGR